GRGLGSARPGQFIRPGRDARVLGPVFPNRFAHRKPLDFGKVELRRAVVHRRRAGNVPGEHRQQLLVHGHQIAVIAVGFVNSSMVNSGLCWVEIPSLRKLRLISYTRSSPPTTNLFRNSSGAMRKKRSMSSALWWVTNGRAAAPPAMACIMGVSTST